LRDFIAPPEWCVHEVATDHVREHEGHDHEEKSGAQIFQAATKQDWYVFHLSPERPEVEDPIVIAAKAVSAARIT
jgi:hypothetical protein